MSDALAVIRSDRALSGLAEEVRTRLDDDPGHDFHHALRVASTMLNLDSTLDRRQVIAAALLCSNGGRKRHCQYSTRANATAASA